MMIEVTMPDQVLPHPALAGRGPDGQGMLLAQDHAARRLVAGWGLLALVALALSTLCAALVVAARAPLPGGLGLLAGMFRSALVLHVNLAVVVWFLAAA